MAALARGTPTSDSVSLSSEEACERVRALTALDTTDASHVSLCLLFRFHP